MTRDTHAGPSSQRQNLRTHDVSWDMFQDSSDNIHMFADVVTGFIGKLVSDIVPKVTIKTYPNQTPWVDKTICDAVNKRTAVYNWAHDGRSGLKSVLIIA